MNGIGHITPVCSSLLKAAQDAVKVCKALDTIYLRAPLLCCQQAWWVAVLQEVCLSLRVVLQLSPAVLGAQEVWDLVYASFGTQTPMTKGSKHLTNKY